jgi:transposase-like protein
MTDLTNPAFTDENVAREVIEASRWANGRFCPHCGAVEGTVKVEGRKKSHRPGLYYCNACQKQFTVTVGTLYERSHIPLNKWLLATHLLSSSKKGISAHQLHRMLGLTYRSAWFMAHRIREAMNDRHYPGPMGGNGGTVEADETFIGPKKKNLHKRERTKKGRPEKQAVLAMVERGGKARSFHIASVTSNELRPLLRLHVSQKAHLKTDEAAHYRLAGKDFTTHEMVNHMAEEYVRGEAHTNTVEGYFSVLKRGIYGTYQHVSPAHLRRYLTEFDFRYNNRTALGVTDAERAAKALKGIEGKRLTYRRTA